MEEGSLCYLVDLLLWERRMEPSLPSVWDLPFLGRALLLPGHRVLTWHTIIEDLLTLALREVAILPYDLEWALDYETPALTQTWLQFKREERRQILSAALEGQQHMLVFTPRGSSTLRRWTSEVCRNKHGMGRWLVKELSLRAVEGTVGIVPNLEGHLELLLQQALRRTGMLNTSASVVARFSEIWVPAGRETDFLSAYRSLWPDRSWCQLISLDPADYLETVRRKVASAFPNHILVAQHWTPAPSTIVCSFEDEPISRGTLKTGHRVAKRQKEERAIWRTRAGP